MNCKNANWSRAINRANANICLVLALALVARVAEGQAVSPIGMSVSGGWTSFDADARQLREAGAHVHVGLSRGVAPYLVAGAGSMSIDQGGGREAHLVLAFGGGITLPSVGRLRPFVEGQFLRAMTGAPNSFIPISVGFSF